MSTPAGAHPSAEEVDALLDGDGTGGDPSVSEHVLGCPTCLEVRAALSRVRDLLHDEALRVPDPPAGLDARIATALAGAGPVLRAASDASQASAQEPDRPDAAPGGDVVPLDSRRRRAPRWLGAAAGVAVLGGVALVTAQLFGGSTGVDATTAGGAADESAAESAAESPARSRKPAPAWMPWRPDVTTPRSRWPTRWTTCWPTRSRRRPSPARP